MSDHDAGQETVVVFQSPNPEVIAIARGALDAADIRHFTEGEPVAALALPVNGMPLVRIRVLAPDAEAARRALQEAGLPET